MQKLTTVLITLAITLSLLACNDRSVGIENNNNQNTNFNNNNNNQTAYLTRHILYFNTATEVMGFPGDAGPGCHSGYIDVDDSENHLVNEYLCWALSSLHDLDVDTTSRETGMFLPDEPVNRAEMWRAVTNMIGFMPYEAQCTFINENEWYSPYMGALCDKGLLAEYEPAELVTIEEWSHLLYNLKMFMQVPAERAHSVEVLIQMFVGTPTTYQNECISQFQDVMDNTFACTVSNRAVELGLLVGYADGTFQPDNTINWAELFKLTVFLTYVDPDETGCYETDCDTGNEWYCQYVDPFCERGLIPESMEHVSEAPTYGDLFQFFYDVYIHLGY